MRKDRELRSLFKFFLVFSISFLIGLNIHLHGFKDNIARNLQRQICEAGGNIVDLTVRKIDYQIVPFDIGNLPPLGSRTDIKYIVNQFWLVSGYVYITSLQRKI